MNLEHKYRYFLKEVYMGSDREDLIKDFIEYLQNVIKTGSWSAMSDHELFLQGGKRAIEEVIAELSSICGKMDEREIEDD